MKRGGAAGPSPRSHEGDSLRANSLAIRRLSAILNSSLRDERLNSAISRRPTRGMEVRQHGLIHGVRSEEVAVKGFVLSLVELEIGFIYVPIEVNSCILRTGFQAATAAHALAERIGSLLFLRRLTRSRSDVVVTIDRNPSLHFFQSSKEAAAVDDQIANHRELGKRTKLDGRGMVCQEPIHKRRTSLPYATVNQHRARTADFLQAVGVVGNGRYELPVCSTRFGSDPLQHAGYVHRRLVSQSKRLPVARVNRPILPQDANLKGTCRTKRLKSSRHRDHSASV